MPASGSGISRPVTMDTKGACGLVVDPAKFDKVFAGDLPKPEAGKLNREQIPTAPSIFEIKASVGM